MYELFLLPTNPWVNFSDLPERSMYLKLNMAWNSLKTISQCFKGRQISHGTGQNNGLCSAGVDHVSIEKRCSYSFPFDITYARMLHLCEYQILTLSYRRSKAFVYWSWFSLSCWFQAHCSWAERGVFSHIYYLDLVCEIRGVSLLYLYSDSLYYYQPVQLQDSSVHSL